MACFAAMLFIGSSYGVQGERAWSLSVTFTAFFINFVLLTANIFTLNTKLDPFRWFIVVCFIVLINLLRWLEQSLLLTCAVSAINNVCWPAI